MKKIAILGATGSIGTQTLEVIKNNSQDFEVVAISVGRNIKLAQKILNYFKTIKVVSVSEKDDLEKIQNFSGKKVWGEKGLIEVAIYPDSEILVTAVVGAIGLVPTVKAIEAKKDIALANKETLVTAGHIIMPLIKKYQVKLLPVDSEHSAIFQILHQKSQADIEKIILTASGGSLRNVELNKLKSVSINDVLNHPNWEMGAKITVDSATMFNKGLEVIEAHYLFGISYDNIEVVIHPQSIIHSMVEFSDYGVFAQLGTPDMKLPIQYALTHPHRYFIKNSERLNFSKIDNLEFSSISDERYPALNLAYYCGRIGGSMPTVFNAANEEAVNLFLQKKITFLEIYQIVKKQIEEHQMIVNPDLKTILKINHQIRKNIKEDRSG